MCLQNWFSWQTLPTHHSLTKHFSMSRFPKHIIHFRKKPNLSTSWFFNFFNFFFSSNFDSILTDSTKLPQFWSHYQHGLSSLHGINTTQKAARRESQAFHGKTKNCALCSPRGRNSRRRQFKWLLYVPMYFSSREHNIHSLCRVTGGGRSLRRLALIGTSARAAPFFMLFFFFKYLFIPCGGWAAP